MTAQRRSAERAARGRGALPARLRGRRHRHGGDRRGRATTTAASSRSTTSCAQITGYPREQLLRMTEASLLHPDDLPSLDDGHPAGDGRRRPTPTAARCGWSAPRATPSGPRSRSSVVRDSEGEPQMRLLQMLDISERKRFEGQLQHLADHDPLTGLINRRRFEEELERELLAAKRYDRARRGAGARPRQLQVRQRHPRPLRRRRADHERLRPAAAAAARVRHAVAHRRRRVRGDPARLQRAPGRDRRQRPARHRPRGRCSSSTAAGARSASIGVAPYGGALRGRPARSCWWRPTWRCTRPRSAGATGWRSSSATPAAPSPLQRPAHLGAPDRAGADRRRLRAARPAHPQPGRRHRAAPRAAGPDAGRERRPDPARRLPGRGRALRADPVDRPLGGRARRSRCWRVASRRATRSAWRSTCRPSRSPTPTCPTSSRTACAPRGSIRAG